MKLYDWLLKEDIEIGLEYKSGGFHVIGTCMECKHLDRSGKPPFTNACSYMTFGVTKIHLNSSAKDFGCIHFEEKGIKND